VSFTPNFVKTPLKDLSYYRTGGETLGIIAPLSIDDMLRSVNWLLESGKPYFILGGGTNSLVSDEFWDGYVISCHMLDKIAVKGQNIVAGAGVVNSKMVEVARDHGLGDISWMYKLPGQVGGTVRMNARCYGGEISHVVSRVTVVTKMGQIKHYSDPSSLFRGYKDTVFMENGDIICEAEVSLKKLDAGSLDAVIQKMSFCEQDRASKGQFLHPTCGCVFKNNYDPKVSISSGMLLEHTDMKGKTLGGAEVSQGHANFVYNKNGGSADILELSFLMREQVYEKYGVWLEYEMEFLGSLTEQQEQRLLTKRSFTKDSDKLESLKRLREKFQKKLNG